MNGNYTNKKKRLKSTSRYIYENLFLEGRESDITLSALNREWKLHKLYLSQSDYFSSMFNGNWRESNMKHVEITIVDPNITLDSMNTTLGSLYQDEISVEPADATSILGNKKKLVKLKHSISRKKYYSIYLFKNIFTATARLFQLDGLIDQCETILEETINIETVIKYYDAATMYASFPVQNACLKWLRVNLLSHLPEHPTKLR